MTFLDTLSGFLIGTFLLTVAVKGNSAALIEKATRDKAFLQWAIAVAILVYLYSIPELKKSMGMVIAAAFIGLGLVAGDRIISDGAKFWQSLGK